MAKELTENEMGMQHHLEKILDYIGEDSQREGLLETPKRVIQSWKELFSGYNEDPAEILSKTFTETENYDQIVLLRNCDYTSFCEHHQLPILGKVHVGYLADNNVVGISKLARLVRCFAHRFQIQERMTKEIATSIMEHLKPQGVGVVVTGTHLCMSARGVKSVGSEMVTAAMEGVFKNNRGGIKDEFYKMIELR
jgi:GTP cyclohydrolase IA